MKASQIDASFFEDDYKNICGNFAFYDELFYENKKGRASKMLFIKVPIHVI